MQRNKRRIIEETNYGNGKLLEQTARLLLWAKEQIELEKDIEIIIDSDFSVCNTGLYMKHQGHEIDVYNESYSIDATEYQFDDIGEIAKKDTTTYKINKSIKELLNGIYRL
jgi:hypothetical protein